MSTFGCSLRVRIWSGVVTFFKRVLSLVPGQYLLASGGDDSALYVAEFSLMLDDNDVTQVHVTREVSEASAHTSSVTGDVDESRFLL